MGIPLPRPAALVARLEASVEEWPYLDEGTLVKIRSRKVCMTCHCFRHHAGVNCIPVLTCQLHQGLIAHDDRWSQSLDVTFGEVMPGGEPPLLKKRRELPREQAIKLWTQKRQQGWQPCAPQWLPPPSPAER